MDAPFHILVVDDEPNIRSGLAKGLASEADAIETAGSVNEAMDKFDAGSFQLVIADVRMPGDRDGLDLVGLVKERKPETSIIVITAHGTVETAVEAMRKGAFDFISKPVDLQLIRQQVAKAVGNHKLRDENQQLKSQLAAAGEVAGIVGHCGALNDVLTQIRQVAPTDATVLIHGESGTGKELTAKAIHDLSNRSSNQFIAMNLGALPETLLESELFGHEKGAFTDASRQKTGCFERASNGTLFLDEITEIPAKSQVDLLRVLETGQYTRVGGERSMQSNARIISATNRNVPEMVAEGSFREDLYYRLNIVPIEVPPLRKRRDDIPLLVEHFLNHFCSRHNRPAKTLVPNAMDILVCNHWPGNIRQLRNVIERLVVTTVGESISPSDLPTDLSNPKQSSIQVAQTLAEVTEAAEKEAIEQSLASNEFHREQTARSLGISVRTLHYKMNRYNLH